MKNKLWYLVLGILVTVTSAPAWAQVSVEPVDPEPIPQPQVVRRVVAEPRVSVAPNPHRVKSTDLAHACCRTIGAAYNFPRPHSKELIRLGTTLFVQLGNDIEGVWYDGACGWLGAFIGLDVFNDQTNRWDPVGVAYRTAKYCGPAHGSVNNMGVRFRPDAPGIYLTRARVISFALPLRSNLSFDRLMYACRDVEVNYIFTLVLVIDNDPTPGDAAWLDAPLEIDGAAEITEAVPVEFEDMFE